MRYVIGIDLGTTQTKAVLLNESGVLLDKSSSPIPVYFPKPGWVEQDPDEILASVRESVSKLLKKEKNKNKISPENTVVGFDNQGETFVLWEKSSGKAVTPAIVWQDTRGQEICKRLIDSATIEQSRLAEITGLRLDSYFSAPKLLWVFEENPELLERAKKGEIVFGTTETWCLWHLSNGELHVTDPSTASRTLLFDINKIEWDDWLLDIFKVPKVMLPDVKSSAGFAGNIELLPGSYFPIHGLLVDQQARNSLFGQACFKEGDMKCSFGTGSFLLMNIGSKPSLSSNGLLTTVAWVCEDEKTYALDGGVFVTGSAVQWLKDNMGLIEDVSHSDRIAQTSTDSDVIVVPAFQGLAAPHWQTEFKCSMFGISRSTSKIDIVRATLDGIAFRIYEVVESMILDLRNKCDNKTCDLSAGGLKSLNSSACLKVDGGPTKNSYLMQRICDLLDMEVHVLENTEGTAMGVANIASFSAYGTKLEVFSNNWKAEKIFKPKMSQAQRQLLLKKWKKAVVATGVFHSKD